MARPTRKKVTTALKVLTKVIESNGKYARSTKKGYLDSCKIIQCYFPDVYLKDVTPNMIKGFLNETLRNCKTKGKLKGYSTKTREHVSLMLNKLFQLYVDNNELRQNPYAISTISVDFYDDKKFVYPYSIDELYRLLDVAGSDGVVQSFIVGVEEGLRTSEILGIVTSGFDKENQRLQIKRAIVLGEVKMPKTKYSKRHISLSNLSTKILSKIIELGETCRKDYSIDNKNYSEEFFFSNPKTNQPWNDSMEYYRSLKKYFALANVDYRGSQPARHTFVNRSVENGIEKADVADHIGQSSVKVLERNYLHWTANIRGSNHFKQRRDLISLEHRYAA